MARSIRAWGQQGSMLENLPHELLSKVLENLHPADILAIARTNQQLQRILQDKRNDHIWKTSRRNFVKHALPDPVAISEYAMASLLFDRGECMICGNRELGHVKVCSYAFGDRICVGNPQCVLGWEATFARPPDNQLELICNLVPSIYYCSFLSRRRLGKCSGYHKPSKPQPDHRVCKKKDLDSITEDLAAGLAVEQLEQKYMLTSETSSQYRAFISKLPECSKKVNALNTLESIIKETFPEDYRKGYFGQRDRSYVYRRSHAMAVRGLPYDYVLKIPVLGKPDDESEEIWETLGDQVARDVFWAWEWDQLSQL